MGLIGGILLALLVATFSRLLADDIKAWLPRLTESLIQFAIRRLPTDQRERLAEEWAADVADTPGDLARLLFACGLIFASTKIASDSRRRVHAQSVVDDERSVLPARSMVSDDISCGNCGEPIIERPAIDPADRQPCPRCGSMTRTFSVRAEVRGSSSMTATAHVIRGPESWTYIYAVLLGLALPVIGAVTLTAPVSYPVRLVAFLVLGAGTVWLFLSNAWLHNQLIGLKSRYENQPR